MGGLAIAEGIEDALSLHLATGLGAWAAGSANRLPMLADKVPTYVEAVTIAVDDDVAGRRGAYALAQRLEVAASRDPVRDDRREERRGMNEKRLTQTNFRDHGPDFLRGSIARNGHRYNGSVVEKPDVIARAYLSDAWMGLCGGHRVALAELICTGQDELAGRQSRRREISIHALNGGDDIKGREWPDGRQLQSVQSSLYPVKMMLVIRLCRD